MTALSFPIVLDLSDRDPFAAVFGWLRGSTRTEIGPEKGVKLSYLSLEAFYAADERSRRHSPEADFGVGWHGPDGAGWPGWRVSYSGLSGELFAVRLGQPDTVLVLGVIDPDCDAFAPPGVGRMSYYATLDMVLGDRDLKDGWPQHVSDPNGLAWLTARLAAYNRR